MFTRSVLTLSLSLSLSSAALAMAPPNWGSEDLTCWIPLAPLAASFEATGDLVTQGDVHYVTGGSIDLVLTVDACQEIVSVARNGVDLGLVYDPIEGATSWYEIVSTVPSGDDNVVTVRVHFPTLGQGATSTLEVGFSTVDASDLGLYEVTVVDVAEVGGTLPLTITQNELSNGSVVATWEMFGDNDVADMNGETVYDVSYAAAAIDITPAGIEVGFEATYEIDDFCDARVGMDGTFHLETDLEGVIAVWDDEPELWFDMPIYCQVLVDTALLLEPIVSLFTDPYADFDEAPEQAFAQVVEDQVAAATGEDCGAVSCSALIETITLTDDAIVVEVTPPYRRVAIDVPYDPTRHAEPANYGMALPAGERVLLAAGGTADACLGRLDDLDTCTTTPVSPRGLFEWDTSPVPEEWTLSESNIWIFHEERAAARDELVGLTRDVIDLPADLEQPAALLGRVDGEALVTVPDLCAIDAPAEGARLGLGPNDHVAPNLGELGSGSYRVILGLGSTTFEQGLIASIPDCAPASFAPTVEALDAAEFAIEP